MNSMRLYTSNRLDLLAEELAKELRSPLSSPFAQEIIVVQSKGMERWVSLQLATHLGICANCRFPFPNAFIEEVSSLIPNGRSEYPVFDPKFSMWKIMECLPRFIEEEGFEELKHYLDGPDRELKQLQLSEKIAQTFDHYTIYRPELVRKWQAGQDDQWQARLWRELSKGHEKEHRTALAERLIHKLETCSQDDCNLPQRISIFGISYLPPLYLQTFASLSRLMRINLYYLNPSKEYWGAIASRREMKKILDTESAQFSPEELHLVSNGLLASMGAMGRDYFDLLVSSGCEEIPIFPGEGQRESLLGMIQSDVLNLSEPGESTGDKIELSPHDDSVQIHVCHGPMREVEVLYDNLLRMFERDPGLRPGDIAVMTPDIESYTPYIQAVFDCPEDESVRLPYSIADRCMRRESQIIDTFLKILDLGRERVTSSQVLGILDCPFVQSRFNLVEADLEPILRWTRDVQIRWGIDQDHTREFCQNGLRENTWRAGMERLLLGYALPGREERLFCDVLPYDNIEGNETAVLGSFIAFLELLFDRLESLDTLRSLSEWADFLSALIADFFCCEEDSEPQVRPLRQILADMKKVRALTGFEKPIDLSLVRWFLAKHLEQESFGFGFMTGGVTFCSMLPMRSIPFKVICLIGMNENTFPRRSRPPEFDLMAAKPQRGDRSVRDEDRYLFLEAMLCATHKLYISYTGLSSKDNLPIPPSVLVSELQDYVEKGYAPAKVPGASRPDNRKDWLLTRHRLQPFSPAYFRGEDLFSYSRENLAAAKAMLEEKSPSPPFIPNRLSDPEEGFKVVSVDELSRFFTHPARYLLNKRLRIYLGKEKFLLEDTECFELDSLSKYILEQKLLGFAVEGAEPLALFPLQKALGVLPHGTPGELAFRESAKKVRSFAKQSASYIESEQLAPLDVDLVMGGFTLTGRIDSLYPEHLVQYRCANIKAKDRLSLWIKHLVLNAVGEPGYPVESILIGLAGGNWKAIRYRPVEDSSKTLENLLGLYWDGLTRPMRFFPEISLNYALSVLQRGMDEAAALEKAEGEWEDTMCKDEYLHLCFKSGDFFDSSFDACSKTVFGQLINNQSEV